MATCSFIKESKQTAGAMGRVLRYVSQEKKTVDPDGRKYLSGINCGAEVAQQSFMATKNLYGKAGGTFFYHYVQSFSPQEQVSFAEAHQIALELAERFFPGCEVLVATHVDAEHLHSYFVRAPIRGRVNPLTPTPPGRSRTRPPRPWATS